MIRPILIALTLVALLVPAAAAFRAPVDRPFQLDGDRRAERVIAIKDDNPNLPDAQDATTLQIRDVCSNGNVITRKIADGQLDLTRLGRVRVADRRAGNEVLYNLATGRQGEAAIVAWRTRRSANCRAPRKLFLYQSGRPARPLPFGAISIQRYGVTVRNLTRRYAGPEVRLTEYFLAAGGSDTQPGFKRTTSFRYDRRRDRFRRYGRVGVRDLR
jgi:hypothetical protein